MFGTQFKRFAAALMVVALVAQVFVVPGVAHSLTSATMTDSVGASVNETTPYTSVEAHTIDGEKVTSAEFNISEISGTGTLELQQMNDSSWETVRSMSVNTTGVKTLDASGVETISESSDYRLRATATSGSSYTIDSAKIYAETENTAPNASISVSVSTTQVGETAEFDGSGSVDDDFGDNLTHEWDFSDGTTVTGSQVSYPFDSAGDYEVTLTVTDNHGATDTATTTITVEESTYGQTFSVTDDNGSAVENATISVSDDVDGTTVASLTTDSNGSAVASLADGNYSYDITATGFDASSGDFEVAGAAQTHDVTLAEATATEDITVNVVDSNGSAVENATVDLPGLNESATTDSNGSATFAGIAEGTHNVTVTGPDDDLSVDETIEVSENNTEFEVVLSEDASGGGGAFVGGTNPAVFIVLGGGVLVVLLFALLAGGKP